MGMGGEIMMMIHGDEIHGDDVSDFRFAGGWSLLWHTSARFSFFSAPAVAVVSV